MMIIWTNLFTFLLSLFIFIFNVLLLTAIAISPKLHSLSNLLSCNLWIANAITAIIATFQAVVTPYPGLSLNGAGTDDTLQELSSIKNETSTEGTPFLFPTPGSEFFAIAGPQVLSALFNSTVSLLSLLAMAIVQIFGNRQDWLPRSAPIRITVSIWSTVGLVLLADFCLIQITKSIALLFAFHLALLSIFLLINLILHPVNLFFSIRERSENQISRAITEALCLLLHSLSFILLVMLLIWESGQKLINEENIQLLSLQLSAYTIHSIANPLIALLRDPKLAHAIGRLVYTKDRNLSPLEYQTFLTQQIDSRHPTAFSHWIFAEPWIFRFERPPPAYSSRSGSLNIIYDEMVPPIEEPTNV